MEIGLPVLEKKNLNFFFTIYGLRGHLGYVTSIMSSDFHFLVPESFKQYLFQIGTVDSEKIQFYFLYLHTLGQGQEITLSFNTHISSIYSIRCHFFPIEKPKLPNFTLPLNRSRSIQCHHFNKL